MQDIMMHSNPINVKLLKLILKMFKESLLISTLVQLKIVIV